MPVKSIRLYTFALLVIDVLAILSAFMLAYVLRVQLDHRPLITDISGFDFFKTFLVLTPFFIVTLWALGLYSPSVYQKRLTEYGKLVIAAFIGILLVLGYSYVINEPIFPARLVPVYAGVSVLVLLIIGREILRQLRHLLYFAGIGVQRVMIIGRGEKTADIIESLSRTQRSGFVVVATVGTQSHSAQYFEKLPDALSALDKLKIDTIIQTELYENSEQNRFILGATQERHIQYCFVPGEAEFYSGKNVVDVFLGYPIISVHQTPLVGWGEVVKRVFDLALVLLTLPLWGLILLVVSFLQKLFNPGPVFYKSRRLTRYSKPINVYKFRSMNPKYGTKDAAEDFRDMGRDDLVGEYEKHRKVARDPRITWFGRVLRVTSIDELPQLINVLIGDLSLVGPRPILPQELALYRGRGALLHSVKSGVTGLWQVSGRSTLAFDKRVELELYYAQNWSFWLDIKILFKTIGVVFGRGGAK